MDELLMDFKEQIQNTKDSNGAILNRAVEHLSELKALQDSLNQGGSTSSTGIYKWLNMSFKIFQLQPKIKKIHELLQTIAGEDLCITYTNLVKKALDEKFMNGGKEYSYGEDGFDDGVAVENVAETNNNWMDNTKSILLAYLVSEKILKKLVYICENKPNITDEDLGEYAFTELNAIFSTY